MWGSVFGTSVVKRYFTSWATWGETFHVFATWPHLASLQPAHPSQAWQSPSQLGSAMFSSACPGLPSSAQLGLIRIVSAPLGGQP